jgi:tetratricopeptide (TPR) repeat protein
MLSSFPRLVIAVAVAICFSYAPQSPSFAMGTDPPPPKKPAVDCKLAKNKNKPECRQKSAALSDDELYYAGYWLARAGRYAEALSYLRQARSTSDPRILNYMGFTTRKLGDVATAIGYYNRALEVDPNYTVARAYLGEAYLQMLDAAKAREQLAEIERRCGTGCLEYAELSAQIDAFESDAAKSPGKT